MKRFISLVLALVLLAALAVPAAAASKKPQVKEMNFFSGEEWLYSHDFSYDKKGRVSKMEVVSNDPDDSGIFYKYSYDKKGNLKKATRYVDGVATMEHRYTHTYRGNRITATTYTAVALEDGEEIPMIGDKTTYKYDKLKRLVRMIRTGGALDENTEYTYDTETVTATTSYFYPEDNTYAGYYKVEYQKGIAPVCVYWTDDLESFYVGLQGVVAYDRMLPGTELSLRESYFALLEPEGYMLAVLEMNDDHSVEIIYE